MSRRKVAAALKVNLSTVLSAPVTPESYCDWADALRRLARSSSAGRHPPALPLPAPPPRLSPRAHRRSMRPSRALTGPRARASQVTSSGIDRAAVQRTRAAVARWRAIGALAPPAAWRATIGQSAARRWWRVGVGAVGGGLVRRVASHPGGARAGRPRRPSRGALCACDRHGPQRIRRAACLQQAKMLSWERAWCLVRPYDLLFLR